MYMRYIFCLITLYVNPHKIVKLYMSYLSGDKLSNVQIVLKYTDINTGKNILTANTLI
jgi:hypothetical protein